MTQGNLVSYAPESLLTPLAPLVRNVPKQDLKGIVLGSWVKLFGVDCAWQVTNIEILHDKYYLTLKYSFANHDTVRSVYLDSIEFLYSSPYSVGMFYNFPSSSGKVQKLIITAVDFVQINSFRLVSYEDMGGGMYNSHDVVIPADVIPVSLRS